VAAVDLRAQLEERGAADRRWFADVVRSAAAGSEPDAFSVLVAQAIDRYGVSVADLCEAFADDKGTVSRWKNGRNTPAPQKRKEVLEWLAHRLVGAAVEPVDAHPERRRYASLDALLGRGVAVHYRRGVRLAEPVFVDFIPHETDVTVYLPEEANRLWLCGTTFQLDPAGVPRCYYVRGLSPEFLDASLEKNASDPLCYSLDWDSDAAW
jgi:transcriptional regulator with XRE-family HTH domain